MRPVISRGWVVSILAVLGVAVFCTSAARADLYILNYQPQLHDRFYSGADKSFIGQAYNWSGVGKEVGDPNHWATMISSQYFLTIGNKAPSGSVTFYSDNTTASAHTYAVDPTFSFSPMYNGLATDIHLGRLTAPIPSADGICSYPVLNFTNGSGNTDDAAYVGQGLYVYGKPSLVGRNVASRIVRDDMYLGTPSLEFDYDTGVNSVGADEAIIMGGDGGAPTFGIANGQLALVGLHMYNSIAGDDPADGDTSGDAFLPDFVSQLMAQMGGQTLYTVPEPVTLTLLAAGGLLMLRRRKTA